MMCGPQPDTINRAGQVLVTEDDTIADGHQEQEQAILAAYICTSSRPGVHSARLHLELWKMAKIVVIPKPGKPDYSKVRAYRVISLLDVISKLVERTVAHLIADHLERRKERGLHDGQFECRAVAVLMNRTQRVGGKEVVGVFFMDVKSALM